MGVQKVKVKSMLLVLVLSVLRSGGFEIDEFCVVVVVCSLFCPDITVPVDWALNTNLLTCFLFFSSFSEHGLVQYFCILPCGVTFCIMLGSHSLWKICEPPLHYPVTEFAPTAE